MEIKDVKFGRTTRKDFSKVGDYIEMPNLIKVQKDSYDWFVEEGRSIKRHFTNCRLHRKFSIRIL